jgi:hypothetical protein
MDTAMLDRLRANFTEPLVIPGAELDAWLTADNARWSRLARELEMRVD